MISLILLRSSIATLVAWSGAFFGMVLGARAKHHLTLLVNASLGALLAVTVFDILPDSAKLLKIPVFLIAVASGGLIFWLIGKYVYPICPACSDPADAHLHSTEIARTATLLMITLGLHSFMDGAAIVIADKISSGGNIAVLLVVSIHKFPEGLALILLLIGSGYRRRPAFAFAVVIEATTELGAIIALLGVNRLSHQELGLIFANIGGGFLYLVLTAIASQSRESGQYGGNKFRTLSYITGASGFAVAAAIMIIGYTYGH